MTAWSDGDAIAARFVAARSSASHVVLEGFHAVKHAIRFGAAIDAVFTGDRIALQALAMTLAPDIAAAIGALAVEVSPACFGTLVNAPTETGVVALAERVRSTLTELEQAATRAPMVLLESPTHLGNIGAVIRVAAGAGAGAVLTTGPHDPWHSTVIRGSAGLHYALPVLNLDMAPVQFPLGSGAYPIIAIDPDGIPLDQQQLPHRGVFVFGSERRGLSAAMRQRATRSIAIPMEPGVSSLNLATSVAIVLYAWRLGLSARA